jgi:hypothetical protein
MTKRRILLLLSGLWILSALAGFSDFFSGLYKNKDYINTSIFNLNYCEYVYMTKYQEEYPLFAIAIICMIVMIYIYIKIYITVRKHQQSEFRQLKKNKKAIITTLLLLGSFIVCWLPTCITEITLVIMVRTNYKYVQSMASTFTIFNDHLVNLLLLNAVCDPLIYSIRLTQVWRGYKMMFCKCCRWKGGAQYTEESEMTRNSSLSRSYRGQSQRSQRMSDKHKSTDTTCLVNEKHDSPIISHELELKLLGPPEGRRDNNTESETEPDN